MAASLPGSLILLPLGGGKMRDPGNEVQSVAEIGVYVHLKLQERKQNFLFLI